MKKIYIFILIILIFSLGACSYEKSPTLPNDSDPNDNNSENTNDPDTIAPLIFLNSLFKSVEVDLNDQRDLDLLYREGVTAIDNIDGNITDKIIIDSFDVDTSVAGSYTIYIYVADSSGNLSEIITKEIIVKPMSIIKPYPIFTEIIVGEKEKPEEQRLFEGAWYHKVVSSNDQWLGIEGTITLPEYKISRYDGPYNDNLPADPNVKNLDNPSIYLGGDASFGSDVGLTLGLVYINQDGRQILSTGSYAFRPFWRYITNKDKDVGGPDLSLNRRYGVTALSNTNMYANWLSEDTEFYYLPGDKLRIIVYTPKPDFLQLQIEVIEVSKNPYSIQIRNENNWKDPEDFYSPLFSSPGQGRLNSVFKRVNAIDQVANEGKPAILTDSFVDTAIWESVYLHRKIDGVLYRIPFNDRRTSTLNAPLDNGFTIVSINDITGGTSIKIHPNKND